MKMLKEGGIQPSRDRSHTDLQFLNDDFLHAHFHSAPPSLVLTEGLPPHGAVVRQGRKQIRG